MLKEEVGSVRNKGFWSIFSVFLHNHASAAKITLRSSLRVGAIAPQQKFTSIYKEKIIDFFWKRKKLEQLFENFWDFFRSKNFRFFRKFPLKFVWKWKILRSKIFDRKIFNWIFNENFDGKNLKISISKSEIFQVEENYFSIYVKNSFDFFFIDPISFPWKDLIFDQKRPWMPLRGAAKKSVSTD